MKQYQDLLAKILVEGEKREDRTGVGTVSIFGHQMRFNLEDSFPLVTIKKVPWKPIVSELLWFIEGSDDERRLAEILYDKPRSQLKDKTTIWTANADKQGKELGYLNCDTYKGLGPIYGVQWRYWRNGVDQLTSLVDSLKNDPYSRRQILSAWNVGEIEKMALPPCHCFAQFYVSNDKKLSCHMNMRSVDTFLGLPFNMASYALLTHMLAQVCEYGVGDLVISTGDTHLYLDSLEAAAEILEREPTWPPTLEMNPDVSDITKFTMNDFKLIGYDPHPAIKVKMAA